MSRALCSCIKNKIQGFFPGSAQVLIVAAGLLLRIKHLAENRSFWLDESYVAVNITSRSFIEILSNHEILPEFARQPMVFSLIEKCFVSLFGNTELALRILPFLSGIGALLLFAVVAKKLLEPRAYLIGLALFALAEPLVYYSAELKQYSTDLFCAILMIEAVRILLKEDFRPVQCLLIGMLGAAILWLSNSMIFVLAGISPVILLNKPWAKGWRVTALLCLSAFFWFLSFILLYYFSLRFMVGKTSITDTWQGAFGPLVILSFETLQWAWRVFSLSFSNPVGLKWWWLMMPLFLIGIRVLWVKNRNAALLWLFPILVTFLAALAGKYPFYERVILFLTAGYFLFIAAGINEMINRCTLISKKLCIAVLFFIFLQPVIDAGYFLVHSRSKTDNRSAMEFLSNYYMPGDFIYLSTLAQEPFWYYSALTGLSKQFPQPIVGIADGELIRGFKIAKFALDPKDVGGRQCMFFRSEYLLFNEDGKFRATMGSQKDNDRVSIVPIDQKFNYPATGRTWLFLSGPSSLETSINALILSSFDKRAKRLLSLDVLNAGIYLYEFR